MEPLSLKLFGEVTLTNARGVDIALPRKTQMLLAYLAADGGRPVPRDKLAGLIWADRLEEQARHSLRQCLFTLAKAGGDDTASIVIADRHSVALNPDLLEADTWLFERLLADDGADAMDRACALYGGDFLAGIDFEDETLDAWSAAERTRLRELMCESLAALSAHYGDTARLDDAIAAARRLLALDPLREDGHRALMRLFARAGRRAEALKQFAVCRDSLRAELNVGPEPATVNLHAEISGRGNGNNAPANQTAPPPSAPPGAGIQAGGPAIFTDWRLAAAGLALFVIVVAASAWLSL